MIKPFSALPLVLAFITTTGCSVEGRSIQRYAGKLHSTGSACPPTDATLVVQNNQVVFAPENSTWLLTGRAENGSIEATATRPSFDHKTYSTSLRVTVDAAAVSGTYMSPYCTYEVSLARY